MYFCFLALLAVKKCDILYGNGPSILWKQMAWCFMAPWHQQTEECWLRNHTAFLLVYELNTWLSHPNFNRLKEHMSVGIPTHDQNWARVGPVMALLARLQASSEMSRLNFFGQDHRPYSRQVTEQLPLSGSFHSHQITYLKATVTRYWCCVFAHVPPYCPLCYCYCPLCYC